MQTLVALKQPGSYVSHTLFKIGLILVLMLIMHLSTRIVILYLWYDLEFRTQYYYSLRVDITIIFCCQLISDVSGIRFMSNKYSVLICE